MCSRTEYRLVPTRQHAQCLTCPNACAMSYLRMRNALLTALSHEIRYCSPNALYRTLHVGTAKGRRVDSCLLTGCGCTRRPLSRQPMLAYAQEAFRKRPERNTLNSPNPALVTRQRWVGCGIVDWVCGYAGSGGGTRQGAHTRGDNSGLLISAYTYYKTRHERSAWPWPRSIAYTSFLSLLANLKYLRL